MLKKMMLLTIAVTTLLAPAALAGHDGDRFTPTNRIVVLADNLLDATRQMRSDAQQRLRGRHGRSGELLFALDRLEQQTRHFRFDAVRDARPRHLDTQLDRLLTAFDRADRQMRFVRSGRLHRDFDRVDRAMRMLVRDVEIATGPVNPRRRGGLHGAIVLGDRGGDGRFRVRIRF